MSLFRFLKSRTFFIQVIGFVIVFLVLFMLALQWWLDIITNHDQKIQVPNLYGMSLSSVKDTLRELDLDFLVIDSVSFNPNHPKKAVVRQTPEAKNFVKQKRKIYLTLNPTKYRKISVPDVNGRSKRHVISQLQSIGFKIGEFHYIPDIGKDVVRGLKSNGKELKPGSKLDKNTVIDLILGDDRKQQ